MTWMCSSQELLRNWCGFGILTQTVQSALQSGFSFLGSSGNSKRHGEGWNRGQGTRPSRVMGLVFCGAAARQNSCMLMEVVTSSAHQEGDTGLQ